MDEEMKKEINEMISNAVTTAVTEATKHIATAVGEQLKGMQEMIEKNVVDEKNFLDKDLTEDQINKLSEEDKKAYFMHKSCVDFAKNGVNGSLGGKDL